MYTLKSIARRGMPLGAAMALVVSAVGSAVLPAMSAYADALNPLTDRSLTLSSSSPGWSNTDGSGNSVYAPPNSGANGEKTGNYFSFKPSSSATVKTFSFQYCTTSAGDCEIPGDNSPRGPAPTASTSDLHIEFPSATEISGVDTPVAGDVTLTNGSNAVVGVGTDFVNDLAVNQVFKTAGGNSYTIASISSPTNLTITSNAVADETNVTFTKSDFAQVINPSTGDVRAVPGYTNNNPKYQSLSGGVGDPAEAAKDVAGNYIVMYNNGGTWTQSTGWTVEAHNVEDDGNTATDNYITLTSSTGHAFTAGQEVKVLFFATATNYITNPGQGEFFVKINTYSEEFDDGVDHLGLSDLQPVSDKYVIDGGVTVANVMNQSIQITTKVLETMQFSVGTVDPHTLDKAQLQASDNGSNTHTSCDTILTRMIDDPDVPHNVLQLGNQSAESSLETDETYATHSYWRLSSNSSAGATVYYSGHTLSNTVGDEIDPIGPTAKQSLQGSEQFGLALATAAYAGGHGFDDATYGVNYQTAGVNENGADNNAAGIIAANQPAANPIDGVHESVLTDLGAVNTPPWDYSALNASFHMPRLDPLVPEANYANGSGTIINGGSAQFAFDPTSDTVPVPIASQNTQVVDCVTAKMRYIANIAATTPAGIYTTKINYIAAPQY